jgi:hypothetical protein
VTDGRGTQSQKGISAPSSSAASVGALRPNQALHRTHPLRGCSLAPSALGAGERQR